MDWPGEKLGLALVDRALLSKALIQLFANGWSCTPFLVVVWPKQLSPGDSGLCGRINGKLQEGLCQVGPSQTAAASAPTPVVMP